MAKYLQIVEADYPLDYFLASGNDPRVPHRIAEAMTAYEYRLQQGKIAGNGVSKAMLSAGPDCRIEDLGDVLRYRHPLGDATEINALQTPHERYVGEVHHALRALGAGRGWDLDALDAIYRGLIDDDYRFAGTLSKPRWNSGKTYRVGVEWRTSDRITLGFVVQPKDGEPAWAPFLTSPIGLGKIDSMNGKFAWQDDRHALLWHGNKRDCWRLDVDVMSVEFLYGPAEEGSAHGQYALGRMYLDGNLWVERDPVKARYWLQKAANQGFDRAKRLLAET